MAFVMLIWMWGSLFTAVFKIELLPNFSKTNFIIDSMTMIESILAIVISLITVITSTALGVRWLTKHYFEEIKHEMKPNGGQSIKDQVNRMEKDITDLKNQNLKGEEYHEKLDQKVEHLTNLFIEYVSRNSK
jgi:hypothetical protein